MKGKEGLDAVELAKTLVIVEFKASKEYGETLALEASRYSDDGFDLFKK